VKYLILLLKGIGMGAADVIPGVSGGTIAFITGIYEELVGSIKSINLSAFRYLAKAGILAFWKKINGNFLIAVFLGILISIFSLAQLLEFLLNRYPILVWSFFFGLILASAIYIANKISNWNVKKISGLLAGIGVAYLITILTPAQTPDASWFIFISGALAICAMILPGISGAFILLLLGKYQFVIAAVGNLNISILAILAAGALIGIISFSNLLAWLLNKYHDVTIAVLAGFMVGSLNKVWPWKETVSTFVDRHGEIQPLIQKNVLPPAYATVSGQDPFFWQACLLAAGGFLLIFIVEGITRLNPKL
jgi:putative membrane protein